jgi:plasmid stabilization system protein ParE
VEVVLLREAEEEAILAFQELEEVQEGRGDAFDVDLAACLRQLAQFPQLGSLQTASLRRLLLRKFRYGIFYRVEGSRVIVAAILNLRLPPAEIERRLRTKRVL